MLDKCFLSKKDSSFAFYFVCLVIVKLIGYSEVHSNYFVSCLFQLPSDSLLWRAILQVILKDHKPNIKFEEQHVGRTAKKSNNFVSYVHKSFEKLNIELKVDKQQRILLLLHFTFHTLK